MAKLTYNSGYHELRNGSLPVMMSKGGIILEIVPIGRFNSSGMIWDDRNRNIAKFEGDFIRIGNKEFDSSMIANEIMFSGRPNAELAAMWALLVTK